MHSLNHSTLANATAAERLERASSAQPRTRRRHPPPMRRALASLTARVAIRLDSEAARRAIV